MPTLAASRLTFKVDCSRIRTCRDTYIQADRDDVASVLGQSVAFRTFIQDALTVATRNTPEWMEWFAERANVALAAIGDPARVRIVRSQIVIVPEQV